MTTTTELSIETLAIQLRDLIADLWDNDPREIALDYAYLLTGGDRGKLTTALQEFQQTLDERNAYSSDD